MFLSEHEFEKKFGETYTATLSKLKNYIQNPETLRNEVENDKELSRQKWLKNGLLPVPKPDEFKFRMTQYRGLVNHPKRLKNYVIAQSEGFTPVRISLPTRLDIEPISRCNFRCIMCQVSDWEDGKRADNMPFEHLKHIIKEQYGLVEVKLQGFGEPLMHKDYVDMVSYITEKDIWVRTTVNGSLLHVKDNYKRLIDSGVGDVNISIDGATSEVFEGIRRRSNFDTVVKNVTMLNEYANSKGLRAVRMWSLLQKTNRHQLFDFVELAKRMQFRRLTFSVGLADWGQEKWDRNNAELQVNELTQKEVDQLMKINDSGDIEITFWNLKSKYSSKDKTKICNWPFQWGFIGSDMRTSACCMIGNPDVIEFGKAENFTETWNSPRYVAFRSAHLNGDLPAYCKKCYYE